jgi:uncharacterized protein with ATP-grasp and redox domains
MEMGRECVVCIINQMLRVAGHLGLDEAATDALLTATLRETADQPFRGLTSPQYAQGIYKRIATLTGQPDPYRSLKAEQNRWVLEQSGRIEAMIAVSPDPLRLCAELSLLGNIIDYGGVTLFDPSTIFADAGSMKLALDEYAGLSERLPQARTLLMIGDNAGEAVFDRFWLREIGRAFPALRRVYAVRSAPAINDMTREDALEIGMDQVAEVIDSGCGFAGTIPDLTTEPFRSLYQEADLVISKGQGNYETLEDEGREIFFMFKVKCDVVARFSTLPLGSLVLARGESLRRRRGLFV